MVLVILNLVVTGASMARLPSAQAVTTDSVEALDLTTSSPVRPGTGILHGAVPSAVLSAPLSAPQLTAAKWVAPLPLPLRVGRKFDPPQYRWLPGHRGVDLCAPVGTAVRAPRAGVVVYASKLVDREVISIAHGDGLRSTFEPVAAQVKRGQTVAAGQVVGLLQPGHQGDCLHWGVKRDRDSYMNPLRLLLGQVRLLPFADEVDNATRSGPTG